MVCSRKLFFLMAPLITFQLFAMEPVSVEGKERTQIRQAALEIEKNSKLAAIGLATITAIISSPWVSRFLRYTPFVLLGVVGVGFAAYKLSKFTDYWGLRTFFRRNSPLWQHLQRQIRAREDKLRMQNELLMQQQLDEERARSLSLELSLDRTNQLHAKQLQSERQAHQEVRAQHQAEILAESHRRLQAEEGLHQSAARAHQTEQELQHVRTNIERLQQELADMQEVNRLLNGDIEENQGVVNEHNQTIAQLQAEIQQLRRQTIVPTETYESFIQAIDQGQIEQVRRLAANQGGWVNQRDERGSLPLCHALLLYGPDQIRRRAANQQASRAIVEILLTAGAAWNQSLINVADENQRETGFDVALGLKDIELLRAFFAAGARLHNASVQHRMHVHGLNVIDGDTEDLRRVKQEILHLFVQDATCPILFENLNERKVDGSWERDLGVYLCGHTYCQECFNTMIGRHEACGICRQPPFNGAEVQRRTWYDDSYYGQIGAVQEQAPEPAPADMQNIGLWGRIFG